MKKLILTGLVLMLAASHGWAEETSTKEKLAAEVVALTSANDMEAMFKAMSRGFSGMGADAELMEQILMTMLKSAEFQGFLTDMATIYSEVFTEEELMGILDFYRSPAGVAMTEKMPQLMEKMMPAQQKMMMGLSPKLQSIMQQKMNSPRIED